MRVSKHVVRTLALVFGLLAIQGCMAQAPKPIARKDLDATQCTARVSNGPWSVVSGAHTATIRWESCTPEPSTLAYAKEGEGEWRIARASVERAVFTRAVGTGRGTEHAGTLYVAEVQLGGLAPSTCYVYRIEGDTRRGRVCTARRAG